ncbi:MAG: Lrp/AsnC ligand binding domain-containing protein [Parvularcula sp.]|jgi:DNA-binding Lrp family transcriptional regulator|nr:Lrp/AsnC ligand binding domain-containing protein [Parvularcula sp.]
MRNFFVYIKCELGKTYDVVYDIAWNLDPNPSLYSIAGYYDLLAHFQVEDDLDIGRFISSELHKVQGIRDTKTVIAFNTFSEDSGFPFDRGKPNPKEGK